MAAENVTLATAAAVLEELYDPTSAIEDLARSNPLMGMIKIREDAGGSSRRVVVKHTRPQGRSATFANAQTNRRGTKRDAFVVTWASNHQLGGVDGDLISDAKGNREMLVDHISAEIDGCIDNIHDDLGFNVFRNAGGSRGISSADPTDTDGTVTLTNAEDIAHFEVGMVIVAGNDDGSSGSTTVRSGSAEIDTINREAGSFTFVGTITGITTNDHIFVEGDLNTKWDGLDAWCPAAAPGATAFYGVNRSVDPERLGGIRYDAATPSDTTREALVNMAVRYRRWNKGVQANLAVLSPIVYGALDAAMESDKRVIELESPHGEIGYTAIELNTPAGKIPVIEDPSCQSDTAWMLNTDCFTADFVEGEMITVSDEDGLRIQRQPSADGYEFRLKTRGNFHTDRPSAICRGTLS